MAGAEPPADFHRLSDRGPHHRSGPALVLLRFHVIRSDPRCGPDRGDLAAATQLHAPTLRASYPRILRAHLLRPLRVALANLLRDARQSAVSSARCPVRRMAARICGIDRVLLPYRAPFHAGPPALIVIAQV